MESISDKRFFVEMYSSQSLANVVTSRIQVRLYCNLFENSPLEALTKAVLIGNNTSRSSTVANIRVLIINHGLVIKCLSGSHFLEQRQRPSA